MHRTKPRDFDPIHWIHSQLSLHNMAITHKQSDQPHRRLVTSLAWIKD